jgi:DNA-binding NtrC family response regulator
MRVLIVDDNPAYLAACSTVFAGDGHEVVACESFDEGRRWLARAEFDALIADVRLGAYNGLHLITVAPRRMIRIAMSVVLDAVLRRDAEREGARYVLKPNDCATLSALLAPHAFLHEQNGQDGRMAASSQ